MKKKKISEIIFDIFNYVILLALALSTLYPFIYTLSISLSSLTAASAGGLHLYPTEVSLESYRMVFSYDGFLTAYGNTLFKTIVGTALGLFVSLMYAYAISRKHLPARKFFITILLFTMIFTVGKVPMYLSLKSLNLLNSRWVYVLPGVMSAYNVIVAKSYFESVPESVMESGRIDGANEFCVFFKLVVPMSKPIIMTLLLWIAVAHWNSWYESVMYIQDSNKIVVQALLQRIIQQNSIKTISSGVINPEEMNYTSETVKSATIIVTILPIMALYPFVQKYFVKGVTLGAVKG